jgi:uncharacterized protein YbaR (Trm112 family)
MVDQEKKQAPAETPSPYAQWVDECPKCHNRDSLTVFEVTLASTGETFHIESRLFPDGFEFDPGPQVKDASTEEEKVRCDTCGQQFRLDELSLPVV